MCRLALAVLAFGLVLGGGGCGGGSHEIGSTTTSRPASTTTTSTTTRQAPASPAPIATSMSWEEAGAFVWHGTDVSPEELGHELRENGFGWVAVFVHDGLAQDPVEGDWIARFRAASGLPVGGWGALRGRPVDEARLASSLVARDGLDFYVPDAEAEYAYSGQDGQSPNRFARSREFVEEFRRLQPSLPAAVSSYCRPDEHDLDWKAWSAAGFVFLPQAYVNDFGDAASPRACVRGAAPYFPASHVHPMIGMYPGLLRSLAPDGYARRLEQAGTVGFSVYLAETRMTPSAWQELGAAIRRDGIAAGP